jgi:hypothetical protein
VVCTRQGSVDSLLIYLDPSLVTQVAAESFEFDPSRTVVPPADGQFSSHFKRIVGVTPRRFSISARKA